MMIGQKNPAADQKKKRRRRLRRRLRIKSS
jgi:hypothetical protein